MVKLLVSGLGDHKANVNSGEEVRHTAQHNADSQRSLWRQDDILRGITSHSVTRTTLARLQTAAGTILHDLAVPISHEGPGEIAMPLMAWLVDKGARIDSIDAVRPISSRSQLVLPARLAAVSNQCGPLLSLTRCAPNDPGKLLRVRRLAIPRCSASFAMLFTTSATIL